MKISLNLKLDNTGAYGFLKPISDVNEIDIIDVFRDTKGHECKKVRYHVPLFTQCGPFIHLLKLFQMVKYVTPGYSLSVGIYEIPHGLLAYILGSIKKIPSVISIIGNPGYKIIRKGLRQKVTNYILKRCSLITVTGSKSKQILICQGIPENKILILPNSINTNKFKIIKSIEKEYDIISLGRLSIEKELHILLKIIFELKKIRPNIKIGIAGKGPLKTSLHQDIKHLGLHNNVFLLGYVKDSIKFYNSGKIFVLTSRTEGLPRTVIEAMACGVPCIASNVGDLEDLIESGKSGYLIDDYTDIAEYVGKIRKLFDNKRLYHEFSRQSIIKVKAEYSFEAASKVWKEIIKYIGVN